MDNVPYIMLILQGVIFIGAIVTVIFLILRRMRLKREEDFEKRDN